MYEIIDLINKRVKPHKKFLFHKPSIWLAPILLFNTNIKILFIEAFREKDESFSISPIFISNKQ